MTHPRRLLYIRGFGGPRGDFAAEELAGVADEVVTVYARMIDGSPYEPGARAALARLGPVLDAPDLSTVERAVCEQYGANAVSGIVTFCELALPVTMRLAKRLGVTHHDAAAAALRDKHVQRQRLAQAGLPVPRSRIVDPARPYDALSYVGLPAVLKPCRGAGSSATCLVEDRAQLESLLDEAVRLHARTLLSPGSDPVFVLEEYLRPAAVTYDGRLAGYVSVESVVAGDVVHHLGVTDKFPMAEPFREVGDLVPSVAPAPVRSAVEAVAGAAIAGLGITTGMVHTEVQLTADGPRIIEVNGRAGGPMPYLYRAAAGYKMVREAARVALGEAPSGRPAFDRHAMYWTPQSPPYDVELTALEGVDAVRRLAGVLAADTCGQVPRLMRYKLAGPGGGTLLTALAVAPGRADLYALCDRLSGALVPHYRDGAEDAAVAGH